MWPTRAERDAEERARWRFTPAILLGWVPSIFATIGAMWVLNSLTGVEMPILGVAGFAVFVGCFWVLARITGFNRDRARPSR